MHPRKQHKRRFDKLLCSFAVKLVLSCAGKSNVALNAPNAAAALMVFCFGMVLNIFLDSLSLNLFKLFNERKVNAALINDVAV